MANYTVFESSNMHSTTGGVIFDVVATADVENGTIGYIENESPTDGGVIYKWHSGTKAGLPVLIADDVPYKDDATTIGEQSRHSYIIPAGKAFRARLVTKQDRFAVSIEGFTTATQNVAKGYDGSKNVFVTADATTGKLVAKAATTADAAFEGVLVGKRLMGNSIVTTAGTVGDGVVLYKVRVTTLA